MGTLIQDMKYTLRTLLKSPGFVAVAVLTLALGIGANVAIFALVNAVLLQPLPFHEPDRLVHIFDDLNGAGAKDVGMSAPELEDLRHRTNVFERVSALWPVSTALTGEIAPKGSNCLAPVRIIFNCWARARLSAGSSGKRTGCPVSWMESSLAMASGNGNSGAIPASSAGGSA
jgi:hypothetical protein